MWLANRLLAPLTTRSPRRSHQQERTDLSHIGLQMLREVVAAASVGRVGNLLRARFGNMIEPVGATGRIYKALE